jgi:transcriptional regulator with XRE-family HTH domain
MLMSIPSATANMLKDMGKRLKKSRIKKFGNERGSHKRCADTLGITDAAWAAYESGRTEIGFGKVVFFAAFFDVSPAWLLTGEGEMEKEKEDA